MSQSWWVYLDIHRVAIPESSLQLVNRVFRVLVKYIKMTDAVFAEEWACHRAVESVATKLSLWNDEQK